MADPMDIPPWKISYIDLAYKVLTNGNETTALIIPLNAANTHSSLVAGSYRLEFNLDRARYRSQKPDNKSNYRAKAILDLEWK